jgi:hypothetical protein
LRISLKKNIYVTPDRPSEVEFENMLLEFEPRLSHLAHAKAMSHYKIIRARARNTALNDKSGHFHQKYVLIDRTHKIVIFGLLDEPGFLQKLRHRINGVI